jgi:hypothetical protein
VAAEHEQARAHSPVASARPEVVRGLPATQAWRHGAAAAPATADSGAEARRSGAPGTAQGGDSDGGAG